MRASRSAEAFWRSPADAPRAGEPLAGVVAHRAGTVLVAAPPRTLPRTMLAATAAMTAVGLMITVVAGPLYAFTQRAAADLTSRDPYVTSVLPEGVRR